jgi:hypothetical protein
MDKFYHDPYTDREVSIGPKVQPMEGWVRITEAQSQQLQTERRNGARIYLDTSGMPRAFYPPSKPVVYWNQIAVKNPFTVDGGIAREDWTITQMPMEEQFLILKKLRLVKQESGFVEISDGTVFPTDSWTATVMIEADKDFQKGLNVKRKWKVRDGLFTEVNNAQLSEALVLVKAHIQKQFDIESYYTDLINVNAPCNIYVWAIPEGSTGE